MAGGRTLQNATTPRVNQADKEEHHTSSDGKHKASGWLSLLSFAILLLAWLVGFSSRLFAVIRFESIIHEFDPWFNYRATQYLTTNGFYEFLNWFDERAWYPLGRIVGGTVFPGLMVTAGLIHYVLNLLHITVHIRDVCVFLAPVFSGLTSISTFLLTRELWSHSAGLLAACFIAIVPGYTQRSVAGSYDNEGIAIFALQFTYYLWVKSVKTGSVLWTIFCSISYFYMVSAWGGYVFIINLIPLHVLVLLLMQRYSSRVYVAYSTFYIMGLVLSLQIPFVGFQPVRTSEHMAAAGVFGLLQAYAFIHYLRDRLSRREFLTLFFLCIPTAAVVGTLALVYLTYAGYIAPWSGRFYSLWDTGYAMVHIPLIASVAEHQTPTWWPFFFNLHVLVCTFPAGLWFCIKNINDERVFVALYAISAVYFAGVMSRLILTLTPVVCVLSAVAFSSVFECYLSDDTDRDNKPPAEDKRNSGKLSDKSGKVRKQHVSEKERPERGQNEGSGKVRKQHMPEKERPERGQIEGSGKVRKQHVPEQKPEIEQIEKGLGSKTKTAVCVTMLMLLVLFAMHCTSVTKSAYSHPSVVLTTGNRDGSTNIIDDYREAYYWLRKNTDDHARIMSWWDYGYQIAGMANRTTIVDNNTWNNSHIALVGKAMASNESAAYEILRSLDVDYVLVIFGGVMAQGDDISKFLWMVRISEGEHPKDIRESDYLTPQGEYRVDEAGTTTMFNSLVYKMCYYRFGELQVNPQKQPGYDRARGYVIGSKDITFKHLEEAFTSEHWLVRIYKVKDPENREPLDHKLRSFNPKQTYTSKKTSHRKQGHIKNKLVLKKGN